MVEETSTNPLSEEINDLFNEKDTSGQVEAIRELFDKKNIKMKSEVNPKLRESEYFGKLYLLSKLLDVNELREFCDEVITLRISNDRQGRKEAVTMTQTTRPEEKKGGLLSWFR